MGVRSVCNGTLPSRYHSDRLISAPPRRPAQRTLMPLAPCSMVICSAFFIARRKLMRRSICIAMFSATSCASRSGDLISMMSTFTCLPPESFEISSVIFSISDPLRPMTMPGRAVWMVTRRLFHARSMTILDTAARRSFSFSNARILMSLARNSGNSLRLANHLERQSLLTARRKPIGLVFCPMIMR